MQSFQQPGCFLRKVIALCNQTVEKLENYYCWIWYKIEYTCVDERDELYCSYCRDRYIIIDFKTKFLRQDS